MRREGGRGGFEEGGAVNRKDYTRSDSDNWRTLREEAEEDDGTEPGGSWRIAGCRREGRDFSFLIYLFKLFYFFV